MPAAIHAQELSDAVQQFVDIPAGDIAITHVKIIDGTGGPATTNQTVVIKNDRIVDIGENIAIPDGATIIDGTGKSLTAGFVMMHEHMFYTRIFENKFGVTQSTFTFPRMYLAGGNTTIRTAGSVEPQTDINIREYINQGKVAGPKIDVTAPHINRGDLGIAEVSQLQTTAQAGKMVEFWSDMGANSFKVYMFVTREDMAEVVKQAHERQKKVTGHICAVTYKEAADIGIDNIEHGFMSSSDFIENKPKDMCDPFEMRKSLIALEVDDPAMDNLIDHLIKNNVALTSTLPVFEPYTNREVVVGGGLEALSPTIKERLQKVHTQGVNNDETTQLLFEKELAWEKKFFEKADCFWQELIQPAQGV